MKFTRNAEDAQDLTQGFFALVLEKGFFNSYEPSKARFRTFLRICLDRFVLNESQAAGRIKRGGQQELISLDFATAESELADSTTAGADSIDAQFEREWVRSVLEMAVLELQDFYCKKGKQIHFDLFSEYDLEGFESPDQPTYQSLADRYGLSTTDVTNRLAAVRREFRRILLEKIRELTASEAEFRDEVRAVLGVTLK